MGNRAVIFMVDEYKRNGEIKHEVSPGVYLHWGGDPEQVKGFLTKALPRMRGGDPWYSAARFCGTCHEIIDGNLSLGLFNTPDDLMEMDAKQIDERFGCDNAIYLVDVSKWTVEQRGVSRPARFKLDGSKAGKD